MGTIAEEGEGDLKGREFKGVIGRGSDAGGQKGRRRDMRARHRWRVGENNIIIL